MDAWPTMAQKEANYSQLQIIMELRGVIEVIKNLSSE